MAFITLQGTLLDPNGSVSIGDELRFTQKSTTGSTLKSAVTLLKLTTLGNYYIDLQYGLVLVEYKDVKNNQFENLGVVTVNQDSTATTLPELLNAIVPPTDPQLLEFQAILADCVAQVTLATTQAVRSETAASISEAFANQLTTTELIASTATYAVDVVLLTSGFTVSGTGSGSWKQNGVTGQTPSQSPAQLGDALLNDGNGNQWALVGTLNLNSLGASSGSLADSLLFFNAAIASLSGNGGSIYIPQGDYTLSAKPSGDTTGAVFNFEGAAKITDNSKYPDGTVVLGFNQQGTETSYKSLKVNSDTVDQESILGSKVNAWKVSHVLGGGHTGGRHTIYGVMSFNGASDPLSVDRNYVGAQGQVLISSDDGGTGVTAATGKGAFFGVSSIVNADANSTNLLNVTGAELNVKMDTGSSCWLKTGLQVVDKSVEQGTIDAGLLVAASGISSGWKVGLLFSNTNGGSPIDSTGTLVSATGSWNVASGIDFSDITIDGNVFSSKQFSIGSTGSMEIGSVIDTSVKTLDFHTSGSNIDYDSRIQASGGTATNGEGILGIQAAITTISGLLRPSSDSSSSFGALIQRWFNGYFVQLRVGAGGVKWTSGAGTPEGVVDADVGSLYTDTSGGAGTTLYIKESGALNTGWVAK